MAGEEIDDDFFEKVINDIKKSGQPLELKTLITLKKNGWSVTPSVFYNDIESRKKREIDIIAKKEGRDIGNTKYEKKFIVECKKSSNKPWVFFKQEDFFADVWDLNIIRYGNCEAGWGFFDRSITKGTHHFAKFPIHTCSVAAFTNEKESSQIFHAVDQVLSALTFYSERAKRQTSQWENYWQSCIEIVYPITVFEGKLLSASIVKDEITLEESPVVHYRIFNELFTDEPLIIDSDQSPLMAHKSYIVAIVQYDHFEKYIQTSFN